MSSTDEAESEDLREDLSITSAEVVEVVKKLQGGRDLPWDAKGYRHGGAVFADDRLQCCMEVWVNAYGVANRGGGSHF